MLEQLIIQNVAVIEKAEIDLGEGLNVLTGETGAGKSIIIDSINAILGEKISKDLIRSGSEKASIEAVFRVSKDRLQDILDIYGIEIEADGTLLLQREYSQSGKNTCRINGRLSTVSVLREIGQRLIDIHGQHDNQSLLRMESHIDLLDRYGIDSILPIKKEYELLLLNYKEIKEKLTKLQINEQERERRIDLLKYQVDEIEKAQLKINEDQELEYKKVKIANSEKMKIALEKSYLHLYGNEEGEKSVIDAISSAEKSMVSMIGIDKKFEDYAYKLAEISSEIQDLVYLLRDEIEELDYSPSELEAVMERLEWIQVLKRKYGSTIPEILNYKTKALIELEEITDSEVQIQTLEKQSATLEVQLFSKAMLLHERRVEIANTLQEKICNELKDLEMKGTRFKVDIRLEGHLSHPSIKWNRYGLDRVEFLISVNDPDQLKPLIKVASGGEMSRIMLAIKTILAGVDAVPVLIFDEIDVGIGGKAAQKVANKLSYVSNNHQVLCVTHLVQIAGMADSHFLIEKNTFDQSVKTKITKLSPQQQIHELARMIGGDNVSEITLQLASEMIDNAKRIKLSQ